MIHRFRMETYLYRQRQKLRFWSNFGHNSSWTCGQGCQQVYLWGPGYTCLPWSAFRYPCKSIAILWRHFMTHFTRVSIPCLASTLRDLRMMYSLYTQITPVLFVHGTFLCAFTSGAARWRQKNPQGGLLRVSLWRDAYTTLPVCCYASLSVISLDYCCHIPERSPRGYGSSPYLLLQLERVYSHR